jgi:hypothetical protein
MFAPIVTPLSKDLANMFGFFGGLPLHPLVVHAAVVFVMASATGAIALVIRPKWRHQYGGLLALLSLASVASSWLAVESGKVLTTVPGLGSNGHADSGTLLLILLVPFALTACLMYVLDRWWMAKLNEHGEPYRVAHVRQAMLLKATCGLAVLLAVAVMVQTGIVGHSGAATTWEDVVPASYRSNGSR